jgi:GntR family histidine utilization transcriptional repressor
MKRTAACLKVIRRTWQAGSPVTHVVLTYPGDRHHLVARFNPAEGR